MVKDTLKTSNKNSVIAFHDNSSAIRGYKNVPYMRSSDPSGPSKMEIEVSSTPPFASTTQ